MQPHKANIWWGPPRKFTSRLDERKISWLELFYDLVYVIAISRITHHLAEHPDTGGIFNYLFLFSMIYWGWLNGSLYHDLHGSPGIRTRLMTLWQMMAIAALIVCLSSPAESVVFRSTIALMVLQFYITYLWWSVGIYDRHHRQYSNAYILCYLGAFGMLWLSLFLKSPYQNIVSWLAVILNWIPPFLIIGRLRRNEEDFSLSSSMTERLGLFTIIMFGESVLGVIQGTVGADAFNIQTWINFGLGILIVFALWWIFFALLADREAKPGFLIGHTIYLLFIPTLSALGMVGASFSGVLHGHSNEGTEHGNWITLIYGICICAFLTGIVLITYYLHYPPVYATTKGQMRKILLIAGASILLLTSLHDMLHLSTYLLLIVLSLLVVVTLITKIWYKAELQNLPMDSPNSTGTTL